MESLKIIEKFCAFDEKNKKIGKYIINQNPMAFESEFGQDLVHWTDEMLMKLFIEKMGFYKMFSLGNVMSKYNAFYKWCHENGYIKRNPFDNSMYLSYDFLIRAAVEAGNVCLYSRDYVKECCYKMGCENSPYYLSVALSIFEGVRDYKSLSQIQYNDVDFSGKKIRGFEKYSFSDELFKSYKEMYQMNSYKVENREQYFDDKGGYLIRRIIANGNESVKNENAQRTFSMKLKRVGINQSTLYDSGVMDRLVRVLGKERLLEFFFYEGKDKAYKIKSNQRLKEILQCMNIDIKVTNFLYDYKVYALCLKYGVIK